MCEQTCFHRRSTRHSNTNPCLTAYQTTPTSAVSVSMTSHSRFAECVHKVHDAITSTTPLIISAHQASRRASFVLPYAWDITYLLCLLTRRQAGRLRLGGRHTRRLD